MRIIRTMMSDSKTLVARNLEWLLTKHRTNPNALADAVRVPQPTIHRILSGESRDPKTATLAPIAAYFGVTVSALREQNLELTDTGENGLYAVAPVQRIGGRVPVIAWVKAGEFSEIVDNYHPGDAEEWVEATIAVRRHTFALRVEGDSMEPDFPPGMLLIVEPEMQPLPGDFVIARNGGEATFKQLTRDGGDWFLKPLNPRYPIKPLPEDAVIVGVVREAVRKFR